METVSFQEHAEAARREAEQGSLRQFRWQSQRAEKFKEAAELFAKAGLMDQAHQSWWDAQLWFTATAGLGTYKRDESYFRPSAVLATEPAANTEPATVVHEQRVIYVDDPQAIGDDAKTYFDRRLDDTNQPLIQARYADFLFDQKYTTSSRRRIDYATLAVNAYVAVAQNALADPDVTIDAAMSLLRAAFIAASVNQGTLIVSVRDVLIDSLQILRDERRFRYTIELSRALLTLSMHVQRADLELGLQILEEGARIEHEAGRYYAERHFLASIEDIARETKDEAKRQVALRKIAESHEADASARGIASHLVAAAHLEDAIRMYQRLQMPEKVDDLLARIREHYEAGRSDFGQIEVRGEIPRAEVERLYDMRLSPFSLHDALQALGSLDAFLPRYAGAEERARYLAQQAPFSATVARTIIRDDSPTRRIQDAEGLFRANVQRQFLFDVNLTAIVIGLLMERLEREKGLNAQTLGDYLAKWSLMDERHVPFLRRGIERYYADDYISALYILTPQVEGVLRSLLWQGGITVRGMTRDGAGIDMDTLSALLRRGDVKQALGPGDDLWRYLDIVLCAQDGLNLRNDIAHGLVKLAQATKLSCVIAIHLLLCLTRFRLAPTTDQNDSQTP